MKKIRIKDFIYGLITTLETFSLPLGSASANLNWLTKGDHIEVRRGYAVLGDENTGTGKITGLHTATKSDGTEILYRTHGKKLEYLLNSVWTEIGTDALGASADGKDISFAEYHSLGGDYLYINSPYGNFLKIDLATPGTATDVYDVAKNYKGYMMIKQNRMFLWGRTADPTGLYLSKIGDLEDFTYSTPRVAAEGDIIRQDDGGVIQSIPSYGNTEYCLHEKKSWALTLTADDTNATNLIYREKVGIPNWRASVATGDGVYFLDNNDEKDPQIRLLSIGHNVDQVLPRSISKQLKYKNKKVGVDLSDYLFDKAVMSEWGDYVLLACRTSALTENNRLIVYHKLQHTIDVLDYYCSCLAIYGGTLIAGDPLVDNVYTLFSGWDDDDSLVINSYETEETDLNWDGLQKVKKLVFEGNIGIDQEIKIYASVDNGSYVEINSIKGSGDYVDKGQAINVGRSTIGSRMIGGSGSDVSAYHYIREMKLNMDKFNKIKLKFEATGIGYASISSYEHNNIKLKNNKLASGYRN